MSEDIKLNGFERLTRAWLQHYHEKKYWKRRGIVIDPHSRVPKLLRAYYLFYIKRSDAFNNATMGTHLGMGARFASIPQLPHGLYGIMVSHNAVVMEDIPDYASVFPGKCTVVIREKEHL